MLHRHQPSTIIAMMRVSSNECRRSRHRPRSSIASVPRTSGVDVRARVATVYCLEDRRPINAPTPAPRSAPTAVRPTVASVFCARAWQGSLIVGQS